MIRLPLGAGAYRRVLAQSPVIRMENWFFEQDPTNAEGASLISRPGSTTFAAEGGAPYRGMFSQPGVFDGDLFILSTVAGVGKLHRYDVGGNVEITGADAVLGDASFAASVGLTYANLFVASAGGLKVYQESVGATLSDIAVPDSVPISKVVSLSSFVLAVQQDSMRFFFIRPGAITIDALDYESAESEPDEIVDAIRVGDLVWLFGASSMEAWYASGDAERPIQRMQGLSFRIGAVRGSAATLQDTGVFVGTDNVVYQISGRPQRISDHGIEEQIRLCTEAGGEIRTWAFDLDGHFFYVVSAEAKGTFVYDLMTKQWHRWSVAGDLYWNFTAGQKWGQRTIGINWLQTAVAELDTLSVFRTDPGAVPIERVATGILPHRERGRVRNSFVHVYGSAAAGFFDPAHVLSLRFSDTQGVTWEGPFNLTLRDDVTQEFYFQSLGMLGAPGRVFEFTDSGGLMRVDGVYVQID